MDNRSLLYLEIPFGTDDPLGIRQVSGLYGPGTWAGWYIMVLSSWYTLITTGKLLNTPYVGCMLFIHWTGIHLMLQTYAWEASDHTRQGSIAAAFTVTYWGLHYATSQYLLFFCKNRLFRSQGYSPSSYKCSITTTRVALFSLVVPALACFLVTVRLPFPRSLNGFTYGADDLLLPAFYYGGMDQSQHLATLTRSTTFSITILCMAIMLPDTFVLMGEFEDWTGCSGNLFLLLYTAMVFPLLVGPALCYAWRIIVTKGNIVNKSCYFMPCSPQHMAEPDQALAVFVGLGMLVFEHKKMLARVARKVHVLYVFTRTELLWRLEELRFWLHGSLEMLIRRLVRAWRYMEKWWQDFERTWARLFVIRLPSQNEVVPLVRRGRPHPSAQRRAYRPPWH
jgi:hypothetical protein